MNTKFDEAKTKISEMNFGDSEMDFIFADWDNMDEHIDWLLTATREEIADWIASSK
jgi:hypothetical protein